MSGVGSARDSFLFAARVLAQSDRVVAGALQRIESDVQVLLGIVKDGAACPAERQLAAGMGLAVVQYVVNRATEEATTSQIDAVREALAR